MSRFFIGIPHSIVHSFLRFEWFPKSLFISWLQKIDWKTKMEMRQVQSIFNTFGLCKHVYFSKGSSAGNVVVSSSTSSCSPSNISFSSGSFSSSVEMSENHFNKDTQMMYYIGKYRKKTNHVRYVNHIWISLIRILNLKPITSNFTTHCGIGDPSFLFLFLPLQQSRWRSFDRNQYMRFRCKHGPLSLCTGKILGPSIRTSGLQKNETYYI